MFLAIYKMSSLFQIKVDSRKRRQDLYQVIYVYSFTFRRSTHGVSIMVVCEESSVHPQKILNHLLSYGSHRVIDLVDVPSSFPQLGMAEINNVSHIQLRVADLQHNQRKSSTSH